MLREGQGLEVGQDRAGSSEAASFSSFTAIRDNLALISPGIRKMLETLPLLLPFGRSSSGGDRGCHLSRGKQ